MNQSTISYSQQLQQWQLSLHSFTCHTHSSCQQHSHLHTNTKTLTALATTHKSFLQLMHHSQETTSHKHSLYVKSVLYKYQ